jgi:putative transposase
MDRDATFSAAFRQILRREGVEAVRLPPRSPNLSPHIERFMRSIKEECLSRMIFFGQGWLEHAVREYLLHYHQGLGNRLISPGKDAGRTMGAIDCRNRLGGLLRYYYRRAA